MSTAPQPGTSIFGRKYTLQVLNPTVSGDTEIIKIADSDAEPDALRIVFDVYTPAVHEAYWYADIDIYNLDQNTTQKIIQPSTADLNQGQSVILRAGYKNGNYDVIWNGPVFQPLWVRENVTDYKVTLHCILGLDEISRVGINGSYAANTNQTDIIMDIIKKSGLHADNISPNISSKKLPRGKAVFGSPAKYFTQIAEDNNLLWWLSNRGLSVGSPNEDLSVSGDPVIVYTPDTGLVGTPEQTQDGVNFTVFLDPRVQAKKPLMQVKLDQSSIRFQKKQIGQFPGLLDRDGVYVVGAVRHHGDSRGETWYTQITGYTRVGDSLAWPNTVNLIR